MAWFRLPAGTAYWARRCPPNGRPMDAVEVARLLGEEPVEAVEDEAPVGGEVPVIDDAVDLDEESDVPPGGGDPDDEREG